MLATISKMFVMEYESATQGLADNVRRLSEHLGLSQTALARKSGLSQRAVGDLLTYGRTSNKSPTLKTIEKLASAFGVTAWQLQIPGLPVELLQNHRVGNLIENFRDASAAGRENIHRIAESEMHYHVVLETKKHG